MLTYEKSGVSVSTGNDFVSEIKKLTKGMRKVEGANSIGGFASIAALPKKYKKPRVVLSTDGVGTKVLLARMAGKFDTVGIDLVAMSVNDVLTLGAEPYMFLDYFATSKLEIDQAKQIIKGIVNGCKQANCALVGGETAEMPQVYHNGDFDLAGFCMGVLESGKQIDGTKVKKGDVIIGIPSSGIHSNGYSLVRKIFEVNNISYFDKSPFPSEKTWMDLLLEPTRIYVKEILALCKKVEVLGMVHITGGGFQENINRILPDKTKAVIDIKSWKTPALFATLQELGKVPTDDMYRTFNMGIGYVVIVRKADAQKTLKSLRDSKIIGEITNRKPSEHQVELAF
jgi:phosphoribosylformylglycinamidine cyclo-ligase